MARVPARTTALAVVISLSALVGLGFLGYAISSSIGLPALPQIISLSEHPLWLSPHPVNVEPSATAPANLPSRSQPAPASTYTARASVEASASGTFAMAAGTSPRVGTGTLRRYQVTVEHGVPVDPAEFAVAVEETLGDHRSWSASHRWSFQRVGPGVQADFVVRLATPATVDRICGRAGLDTMGQVSCRAGSNVMINLRRWQLAIPAYADHIRDYQHLVINHEVGHFLGFGHVGCPEKGAPAPAMMSQYFGLHGCRPNPWPFPEDD